MAHGVQKRLVKLKREYHACKDPKLAIMLADCCLRHEDMRARLLGVPLPGRARVTQERMRTLDIQPLPPIPELAPPPEPLDSGMDYGSGVARRIVGEKRSDLMTPNHGLPLP
jgi:hypothetical protein